MSTIFCPSCDELILAEPACPACGWQRPLSGGAPVWRAATDCAPARPAQVAVARTCFALATKDCGLVALDLGLGEEVWRAALEPGCASCPAAGPEDTLLVAAHDTWPIPSGERSLVLLDAQSGQQHAALPFAAHSLSAPAVGAGALYLSASDGHLYALDPATLQARWAVEHGGWGPEAPALADGLLVVGGRTSALSAYDPASGALRWRYEAGGWFASTAQIGGGLVLALSWDGWLYALDAQSGQPCWRRQGERGKGFTCAPVAAGELVLIGSRVSPPAGDPGGAQYALLGLSAADGTEIWRYNLAAPLEQPPVLVEGFVLLAGRDGAVAALDAGSGAEQWRVTLERRPVARPAVAGDLLLLAAQDGTCYALRWRSDIRRDLREPEEHLDRGEQAQAAAAYALRGDYAQAAGICEQIGPPQAAAQLYARAGESARAAALWELHGDLRRAAALYEQAGDLRGLAGILARSGEPLRAAQLYEQAGASDLAAPLYEQTGDRLRAADLYAQVGQDAKAQALWEALDAWERLAEHCVAHGALGTAAGILARHGQLERAAQLYEQARVFEEALRLRVELEHWEQVAQLAGGLGRYEQAAHAFGRLGRLLAAADAYELAAQQASGAPSDEPRAIGLYEQAIAIFAQLHEDERARGCYGQVQRLRREPIVVVSGDTETVMVEQEWNLLRLRVENIGHGPAFAIQILPQGRFEADPFEPIAHLPVQRAELRELPLRSLKDEVGPKVPFTVAVGYRDAQGASFQTSQRFFIPVARQGSLPGPITPTQLQITPDLRDGSDYITSQRELLHTYRYRLGILLRQLARHGETHAPPMLFADIRDARGHIRRIKDILRERGAPAEDLPDDET